MKTIAFLIRGKMFHDNMQIGLRDLPDDKTGQAIKVYGQASKSVARLEWQC